MSDSLHDVTVLGPEVARWQKNKHVRDYVDQVVKSGQMPIALVTSLMAEYRSVMDTRVVAAGALATDRSLHFFKPGLFGWTSHEEILFERVSRIEQSAQVGRGLTKRRRFSIGFEYDASVPDGEEEWVEATCEVTGLEGDIDRLREIVKAQVDTRRRVRKDAQQAQQRERQKLRDDVMARARADEPITPEEFALLDGEYSSEYWNVILPRRRKQASEDLGILQRADEGLRLTEEQLTRLQRINPELHATWLERADSLGRNLGERPTSTPIRTPRDAEENAAKWMRYWGFADARVTQRGADEGIDVDSLDAVAQVKAYMVPVGRPDLQNLAGVAAVERKMAIFFALSGYTEQAVAWADRADIALFTFDLLGDPEPLNVAALRLAGLHAG